MVDFVNVEQAKGIIAALYPEAKKVHLIEHGYDNIVGLTDQKYAIKFPRYDHAYNRDRFEEILLKDLENKTDFAIPKVLHSSTNPPYLVLSFIRGNVLSEEQINRLPQNDQQKFAEDLSTFTYQMHSHISIDKTIADQEKVGINDFDFYKYALENFTFPNPEQDSIAKEIFEKWKKLNYASNKVVNHNDLNVMNLLFIDNRLVGVIDFGDARIGYPEQEFRQLYRINEFILEAAVEKYQNLSGYSLNKDAIKVNAIVQELAAYANRIKDPHHPGFIRAKQHLEQWLPEADWQLN